MSENTFTNTLIYGDNLEILKKMSVDKDFFVQTGGGIDLIYIDPPFNSNRVYNMPFEDMLQEIDEKDKYKAQKEAFNDTWSNIEYRQELEELKGCVDCIQLYNFLLSNKNVFSFPQMSYLTMMAHRIYYMHKVLKDTGSFYLHCDPTMSHYLKILLDMVFGLKNFRNEIIWHYRTGGVSKRWFAKKHDNIFSYTKSEEYTFNVQYMKQYYDKKPGFKDKNSGKDKKGYYNIVAQDNVFRIPAVFNMSKERMGYPTQKPLALLERIIKASSNEGDVVADFFCGCGTTIAAAEQLNRKWLGVDINHLAIAMVEEERIKPIIETKEYKTKYKLIGFPKDMASAEKLAKDNKYKFEQWIVEYVFKGHQTKRTGDKGIDGYIAYNFHNANNKSIKKMLAIMEVKGGNVNISQIRAFKNSIENDFKADFGLFIAFDKYITDGMRQEANALGFVNMDDLDVPNLQFFKLKRMYIITIDDILKEILPQELKQIVKNITY